jgi:hypothetical protein
LLIQEEEVDTDEIEVPSDDIVPDLETINQVSELERGSVIEE